MSSQYIKCTHSKQGAVRVCVEPHEETTGTHSPRNQHFTLGPAFKKAFRATECCCPVLRKTRKCPQIKTVKAWDQALKCIYVLGTKSTAKASL